MKEEVIHGIDLGTTYSGIAYVNRHGEPVCAHLGEGGKWTIPSAVLFVGGKVYVGEEAIENSWMEGSTLVEFAKRDIGLQNGRTWPYAGWEYKPEEISALILRKTVQEVSKDRSLPPVRKVVISHPQYFYVGQKEATKEAGELAGLEVVATITEPQAAAIAYGIYEQSDEREITALVFDLGGGTFDVTLMKVGRKRFEMLGSKGNARLGGIDWDTLIVERAKEIFKHKSGEDFDDKASREEAIKLRKEAQRAKEELSKKDVHRFWVEAGGQQLQRAEVTIKRDEFERMSAHLVNECLKTCRELLDEVPHYSWDKVDEILLVGSLTKMPMIQEAVRRASGREPRIDKDPKLLVAKGGAI